MKGAECLLRTLAANGIDLCLMNPGTSEMQFVRALDCVPQVRGVPDTCRWSLTVSVIRIPWPKRVAMSASISCVP